MQNYVHEGKTLTVLAPRTVTSGLGVLLGSIFGVARFDAASGAQLELLTVGVFDLAKDTSTFAAGDKVYWDDTNHVATSASTGNREIGVAEITNPDGTSALGGSSGDATVRVKLNGISIGTPQTNTLGPTQVTQVSLTAAQIIALNSAPVALLAAPGAGKIIFVQALLFQFKYGTVQMTGGGAVNPVYHGATTNLLGGSVAAATIQAAASAHVSCGAPAAALVLTPNVGVDLRAATADFAAGDSTAIVTIYYNVITQG